MLNLGLKEEPKEEEYAIPDDLHEDVLVVIQRPQRTRILPARLEDCEVFAGNEVTKDEDLVHFFFLDDA